MVGSDCLDRPRYRQNYMIIPFSLYVISFASPGKLIPNFLLHLSVAEIQISGALKSLSPEPSANFSHLFSIKIHLTPHLDWEYLCAQRSKYWISLFSISVYLRLWPHITALASNFPLSTFIRNRPKYCSSILVTLKQAS